MHKTALYKEHLKAGATMGDFAGWNMPLYYGSQINEHHKVRQDAGMFDVSHMTIVNITGPEATSYLRHLIANDVAKLKNNGKALYSCMLNEQGGIIDDLIIYRITPEHYRMIVNAATHDKDLAWLLKQQQDYDLVITEETQYAILAIQGPNAINKAQQVFSHEQKKAVQDLKFFQGVAAEKWWIARTGYTGEDGYEIILPGNDAIILWQNLLQTGVTPCGLVARDSLRLEAGLCLYGNDMDETTSPLESNLSWTVAFEPKERDFIGRKALEKQTPIKKLVGLILQGKGILRSKQNLYYDNKIIGETTSGGFSPTLGKSIAMARINKDINNECMVEIRGKQIPAKITTTRFLKQ